MKKKKVAVIGGGTGTMAVLQGLKNYPELDLFVIVSMADDGGSNAVIRDEFGLLPFSDLRKSIIALSDGGDGLLRQLFMYRFYKGKSLSGHTLGNLVMMALADLTGSEVGAVEAASELFSVRGKVIPTTLRSVELAAEYESGLKITGEHLIDEPEYGERPERIKRLFLKKRVKANPAALKALLAADVIIAGPGDLYTTTLASLVVPGVAEAIAKNRGKFIFVSNIMSKYGQTAWMKAADMVEEVARYAKRRPDIVLVHQGTLPNRILKKYAQQGEQPILDDLQTGVTKVVRAVLAGNTEVVRDKGDTLKRSLIRHDPSRLGRALYKEIFLRAKRPAD